MCGRVCGLFCLAVVLIPVAVIMAVMTETPEVLLEKDMPSLEAIEAVMAAKPRVPKRPVPKSAPSKGPRLGSGGMFDKIASVYDATNKWMSLGLDQHWRQTMVSECMSLSKSDRVLDLATGTADVSLLAAARLHELSDLKGGVAAGAVLGVDPSTEMLRRGVEKVDERVMTGIVRLVKGDAQNLSTVQGIDALGRLSKPSEGVADGSIDKISMSFGIRNVPDRAKALREMRRSLRSRDASRVCILEFSLPSGQSLLSLTAKAFITHVVPVIGRLATQGSGSEEYEYLERSILDFPQPLEFAAEMAREGLQVKSITSFAFGAVHLYTAEPATDTLRVSKEYVEPKW
jgi:demethylmenaquinone methyltransferase/2-methoxy-6-polyprenyl-1,4-benzoquinol methylase